MKIQFTCKLSLKQAAKWNKEKEYQIEMGIVPKLVWLNTKQQKVLNATQKTQIILAGRGWGKSKILHYSMRQRCITMPRGSFALAAPTFEQLKIATLRGFEESWAALGWIEGRDYVMFKEPPKDWTRPYASPESWDNTIACKNGSYYQLLTNKNANSQRGGSFDAVDADEVAWQKEAFYVDVLLPSLRGNREYFFGNPYWQTIRLFTSMPDKTDGYWIFKYEELYKQERALKGKNTEYRWLEGNAYDNIEVWGEEGIERLRKEMPHLKFQREVMNVRIHKAERAFYHKYNPEYHAKPYPITTLIDAQGYTSKGLLHLKRNEAIDITIDFSGWFMCCIISQYFEQENIIRNYHEFFRDGDDMLRPMVSDVCKYLQKQGHKAKYINVYGEPRGHDKRPDGAPLYHQVAKYFADFGYETDILVPPAYRTEDHALRNDVLNEAFAETNPEYPRIELNIDGCPNLSLCLQSTAVKHDSTKDKSKERDRNYPQYLAPHLTDALDYHFFQRFINQNYQQIQRPSSAGIM